MNGTQKIPTPEVAFQTDLLPLMANRIIRYVLVTVGVVTTILAIASDFAEGNAFLEDWIIRNASKLGVLLHLIFFILVLFPGLVAPLNSEADDKRLKSLTFHLNEDFLRSWKFVWIAFGVQYTIRLYMEQNSLPGLHMRTMEEYYLSRKVTYILNDLANYTNTYFLLVAYYHMSPAYFASLRDNSGLRLDGRAGGLMAYFSELRRTSFSQVVFMLVMVFCIATIAMRASDVGYFGANEPLWRLPSMLMGFVGAMAVGIFAGRLDSKFVLDWQWIVPIMFLYAAIQTFTALHYEERPIARAVLTYGAFTMKCILYLYVSNFFEKRRVLYYAHRLYTAKDDRV